MIFCTKGRLLQEMYVDAGGHRDTIIVAVSSMS